MPISKNDIKLMQPERLTDDEDGGGQMTGLEVIDGDINNLFEDISRVDRTYGETSLRKVFLKVDTATADRYLDAHSILSAQPADPNVSGLLFTTRDFYDKRESARQRVESFVVPGPVTGLYLRGVQLQGQRSLICYSPTVNNSRAPEIGETYLMQEGQDVSSRQFIKVLSVEQTRETFTYQVSGGDIRTFTADQYILELSSELKRDFPAADPNPKPEGPSFVYSTQPAGSAKYFGSTSLSQAASSGATSVAVADTFAPIIPTASNETPFTDQRPGGFINQVVPSGTQTIDVSVTVDSGSISTMPTAIVPGSVEILIGGDAYHDKGGSFVDTAGDAGALEGAEINYSAGLVSWAGTASGVQTFTYQPGTLRQQLPNTGRIDIDETNRNFNYVLSLDPKPAPLTLNVSYQYLGKWYELQDNGTGSLVGDGSGQINYETGSVVVTLQAQPDAGSVIFYRWTEATIYSIEDGAFDSSTPVNLRLTNVKVVPGTVTISWNAGGQAKTAGDGGDGTITGDAAGTINYAEGDIWITGGSLPDDNWSVDYTHKDEAGQVAVTTVPNNANRSDIVLQSAGDIEPGSVSFVIQKAFKRTVLDENNIEISNSYSVRDYRITDNGDGWLINRRRQTVVGTVDYSTGEIVITGVDFLKELNT